jgi:acetoacetyl-CoA synthetase
MPLGFLNDEGGARYKSAYFEEFTTPCWTQGDWIEISSVTGGTVVFGRSDGVLNPSGVRFGSAELYDVVEEMKDIVEDCIAVGQKIENGHDERVILFIKPKVELTSEVLTRIKKSISVALSPRHVPAVIVECPIIPVCRLHACVSKLKD